jgi:hypothetical protein
MCRQTACPKVRLICSFTRFFENCDKSRDNDDIQLWLLDSSCEPTRRCFPLDGGTISVFYLALKVENE